MYVTRKCMGYIRKSVPLTYAFPQICWQCPDIVKYAYSLLKATCQNAFNDRNSHIRVYFGIVTSWLSVFSSHKTICCFNAMHSSSTSQSPPICVLSSCSCDKVYYTQTGSKLCFVFTRPDCTLAIINVIHWIKIDHLLLSKTFFGIENDILSPGVRYLSLPFMKSLMKPRLLFPQIQTMLPGCSIVSDLYH